MVGPRASGACREQRNCLVQAPTVFGFVKPLVPRPAALARGLASRLGGEPPEERLALAGSGATLIALSRSNAVLGLGLALAVVGLAWAPPGAIAARASGAQPRYTMHVAVRSDLAEGLVSSEVLLDDQRTHRSRALRKGVLMMRGHRGRLLGGAPADGRLGVYVEESGDTSQTRVRVMVVDLVTGRTVRRHMVLRYEGAPSSLPVSAVMAPSGLIAWLAPAPGRPGIQQIRVGVSRHARRVVATGHGLERLGIEDSATLRWFSGRPQTYQYLDLRAPDRRDGCPVRERFKPALSTPEALVTEASYGSRRSGTYEVVRACWRATGRDPVVASGTRYLEVSASADLVAIVGEWLVVSEQWGDRYNCQVSAYTVNVATARQGVRTEEQSCPWAGPRRDWPLVVTADGTFAWVGSYVWVQGPTTETLVFATNRIGKVVELDRGPSGTLTDLRLAGDQLAWRNAGADRGAPMP